MLSQKILKSGGLEMLFAYRELFTSYTVSANQCANVNYKIDKIENRLSLYLETSKCLPFQSHHSKFVVIKLSDLP